MNHSETSAQPRAVTIPWWTDLAEALAHARVAQRPLYVDIWAPG
jgi:hypothetical protein